MGNINTRYVVKNKIHLVDEDVHIDEYTYFYIGTQPNEYIKSGYKFIFSKSIQDAVILKTEEQAKELIRILNNIYRNYTFVIEEI